MDASSDDHVLDILARWLMDPSRLSVRALLCRAGPARIQGVIADMSAYTEHLGEEFNMAFREAADAADDEQARAVAAHRADVFARERYVMTYQRRGARRRQIAERLRELDAGEDTAEVSDLEREEEHLGELTPILILRDARVWGPGDDPAQEPSEVPFVRIQVAAIRGGGSGPTIYPISGGVRSGRLTTVLSLQASDCARRPRPRLEAAKCASIMPECRVVVGGSTF